MVGGWKEEEEGEQKEEEESRRNVNVLSACLCVDVEVSKQQAGRCWTESDARTRHWDLR